MTHAVVSNDRLGDIRGAFLEADSLDRKRGPLYWSLPPGGIPGVPDDAVILILGNINGLNDAPQRLWLSCLPLASLGARLMFVSALSGAPTEIWREFCVFT